VAEQQRGMGRGLAAILPRSDKVEDGLREIPPDLIQPNARQPRRTFDQAQLAELRAVIGRAAQIQLIVCQNEGTLHGVVQLAYVAGPAAQMVELKPIPALVRNTEDWERLDIALAENMARVDPNAVEEARACAMLVDDLGLTKQEVGRRVGRSRVAISNLIRLLELPEQALELLESGDLSEGHGKALLAVPGNDVRRRLARDAARCAWSVRETENRVRLAGQPKARKASRKGISAEESAAVRAVADRLEAALGHEVKVRSKGEEIAVEVRLADLDEALELARRLARQGG